VWRRLLGDDFDHGGERRDDVVDDGADHDHRADDDDHRADDDHDRGADDDHDDGATD
jgi:hypothetical protein